jgi:hypothetical protein
MPFCSHGRSCYKQATCTLAFTVMWWLVGFASASDSAGGTSGGRCPCHRTFVVVSIPLRSGPHPGERRFRADLSISSLPVRLIGDQPKEEKR